MRKLNLFVLFSLALVQNAFCLPMISDLKVTPIEPLGLAIDYTVSGAEDTDVWRRLVVSTPLDGKTYTAKSLVGDTNCVNGAHRVYWNMAADGISVDAVNATVEVVYRHPKYCVVDLQGGETATSYPVTYLDVPPMDGFNTSEYKTTKIVLKLLDSGSFKSWCGCHYHANYPQKSYSNSYLKEFSVKNPFYLGLYELTQKQWELVMGTNVCSSTKYGKGDAYPVHCVSYDMIRGSESGWRWPARNTVDATSFLGKLRARTKINFDLPTERQWEYAYCVGTTTEEDNNDGWYIDDSYAIMTNCWGTTYYTRCYYGTREVGTKKANPWGLYDMGGNVSEWCLDWYNCDPDVEYDDTYDWGLASEERGPSGGMYRVHRGGSFDDRGGDANDGELPNGERRGYDRPGTANSTLGFRLALPYL